MEKKSLGSFIAVLRKAKGLTQKQLAEILNVSDKAVSRWERDECAPDLSLIPVLADYFDITADELLRGQRKQPDIPTSQYETLKTEKQLRYLLNKQLTDFRITTCVAITVTITGLLVAMVVNLGFLRAYIGFFASCCFYLAAILCQVGSLLRSLQSLGAEELESVAESPRRSMILLSELSIIATICLFAGCLPLIVLVSDTYAGLSAHSWIEYGPLWALTAAILCTMVCFIINHRLGYLIFPILSTPKNKLRIRFALILAVVMLVTCFTHGVFSGIQYANLHELTAATKWETWEELKAFLETPMNDAGQKGDFVSARDTGYVTINTYRTADGTTFDVTERHFVLVYEEDMKTPEYECIRRNQSIKRFYYSHTNDHFPIYTLNNEQLVDAENRLQVINLSLCSVYILEILVAVLLYRRKVTRLSHAD